MPFSSRLALGRPFRRSVLPTTDVDVTKSATACLCDSRPPECRTDCPLRVDFKEPLTEEQREWLLRTPLTLRRISFCPEDAASSTLLHRRVHGVGRQGKGSGLGFRTARPQFDFEGLA